MSKTEFQKLVGTFAKDQGVPKFPTVPKLVRKMVSSYEACLADKVDPRYLMVHKNQNNDYTSKVNEAHMTVIQELVLVPHKVDFWECWRDYYNYMKQTFSLPDTKIIKYRRFCQICNTDPLHTLAIRCRDGISYYDAYVRPYVLRKKPNYSMSLIAGDGWEPGRSVRFRWKDKSGNMVWRIGTMNVWIWYDWKSSYIVSHRVEPFENSYQIRQSFRDVAHLHGVVPRSVMVDKKWEKQEDTKRMFEKAGVEIQDKRAYNPKSNIAERNNKEMNKHHRHIDPFWIDMTNNSLRFQHNPDWIRGTKPLEEEEFKTMVMQIVERHNHEPRKSLGGKTPHQVFTEKVNPECRELSPLEMMQVFCPDPRKVTLRNYMAIVEIGSQKHKFIIEDKDIPQVVHRNVRRVRVYWDERHLDRADLYQMVDEDREELDIFLCTAIHENEYAINAASVEEKPGGKLQKNLARGRALDEYLDEQLRMHEDAKDKYDITTASVQAVSQEKYKEAHSNNVAKAYRRYYEDQLGEVYSKDDQAVGRMDVDEKFEKLQKLMNDGND